MMRISSLLAGAALALSTVLAAASAQAGVVYSYTGPSAEFTSPGFATALFLAGGGAGQLAFTIDGYTSLDGQGNCCEDDFTLNVNGTDILSGSWNMGGGGNDVTFYAPVGATVVPTYFGWFAGGQTVITTPISLVSGLNSITFSYNGAFQGLGDEGWGLQDITVTERGGGVPEPSAWALMLSGFAGLGAMLRRRRAQTALAAA
jgi:hypothetical protein